MLFLGSGGLLGPFGSRGITGTLGRIGGGGLVNGTFILATGIIGVECDP